MNLPSSAIVAIKNAKQNAEKAKNLRKATAGFEAHFVKQLLTAMRRTASIAGTQDSHETETYRDMMDDSLSQKIAESGKFGLGDMVYKNMIGAYLRSNQPPTQPSPRATTGVAAEESVTPGEGYE